MTQAEIILIGFMVFMVIMMLLFGNERHKDGFTIILKEDNRFGFNAPERSIHKVFK